MFTSWPLGVASLKLFVFSQPSETDIEGQSLDKRLDGAATPSGKGNRLNARVSTLSVPDSSAVCRIAPSPHNLAALPPMHMDTEYS